MNEPSSDAGDTPGARSRQGDLLELLASVRFALVLIVLLAAACVLGTVLPQGGEVAQYLRKHPDGERQMAALTRFGLTHVFDAWWFIALLCALSASLITCSARRFLIILRTTGTLRGRAVASVMTHTSLLLILVGASIRGGWGQKGYMEFREGQTVSHFVDGDRRVPLPFSVRLEKFEIERYAETDPKGRSKGEEGGANPGRIVIRWPDKGLVSAFPASLNVEQVVVPGDASLEAGGSYKMKVVRYVADFAMDTSTHEVTSRSTAPNNPAILVAMAAGGRTNTYWLFSRHPEFNMRSGAGPAGPRAPFEMVYEMPDLPSPEPHIKAFRSTLDILDGGIVAVRATIAVNAPFTYKGYAFYQSGYSEADSSWTSLQVVRDPGVRVVYAGFMLMIAGVFTLFYLYDRNGGSEKKAL